MAKRRRGKHSRSSVTVPCTRRPLFGALKGMSLIPPNVDLTEPADPEWGKLYDGDQETSERADGSSGR